MAPADGAGRSSCAFSECCTGGGGLTAGRWRRARGHRPHGPQFSSAASMRARGAA